MSPILKFSFAIPLTFTLVQCFAFNPSAADELFEPNDLWFGAAVGVGLLKYTDSEVRGFSSKLEVGYNMNRHFGFYSSYDYLDNTPNWGNIHIGSVGIRGRTYLTDKLSLSAKASISHLFDGYNDNGPTGTLGGEVEYQLTHAISLKAGIDYYNSLELKKYYIADLSQFYAGISYRFGQPETPLEIIKYVEITKEVEVVREVEVPKVIVEKIILSDSKQVLFANNSSILKVTKTLEYLLLELINAPELHVKVVGHADNIGSAHYNQQLSERRASSVANYLMTKGISKSRVTTEGKGATVPIVDNDDELGRAQNRRVEIIISQN